MPTHSRSRLVLLATALVASVMATASPASAQGAACDLIGTNGPDVLVGTDADEVICGLGGDDVIDGGGGDDRLIGGSGNDTLRGGAGNDSLLGGPGSDDLDGERGADRLNGQRGSDTLEGGRGRDRLLGGAGVDACSDQAGRTRSRSCEGGELALRRSMQQFASLEITEFVYARSVAPACAEGFACIAALSFPEVVHVRGDVAIGELGDTPARTAEELFADASAALDEGNSVVFDPFTGLPVRYELDGVGTVHLSDIELRDELRAAYDAAVAAWETAAIDQYTFVFRHVCFCPGIVDVAVEVLDGEIVSETPVQEPDAEQAWVPEAKTVALHLARIAELLDGTYISVSAGFDPDTGVPTDYGFDQSHLIADEELTVIIEDFVPAPVVADPVEDDVVADDNAELSIVEVQGIEVSSEIAESLAALLDAATADGFSFSGGGFRDPAAQIALRRANCGTSEYAVWEMPASQCSPPTARPGQSLHEQGLAVDFTNDGVLVTSRASAAFLWLEAHAATFGFFNHPAEPWHWSINGN